MAAKTASVSYARELGPEALEDKDRLLLAAAAALREFVLGQSAFDPNDAFSPPSKTFTLADATVRVFDNISDAVARGVAFTDLPLDLVRRTLASLRDAPASESTSALQRIDQAVHAISTVQSTVGAARP